MTSLATKTIAGVQCEELMDNLATYLIDHDVDNLQSRSIARAKLMDLSQDQIEDLTTDVYDDFQRRSNDNISTPFLPIKPEYHPQRNLARRKLASLPTARFKDLSADIFHELKRRVPEWSSSRLADHPVSENPTKDEVGDKLFNERPQPAVPCLNYTHSLDKPVRSANEVRSIIECWLSHRSTMPAGPWGDWSDSSIATMLPLIERIAAREGPPSFHSGIGKEAKRTVTFPRSLVVEGVEKSGEHPVSEGGFADTFMGSHDGKPVALKVLRIPLTDGLHREIGRKVLIWKELAHPHVLPFMGVANIFTPLLSLVSPWVPNGNILNFLEKNADADKVTLLSQCTQGLLYLHNYNPNLIHGDIKGANILIDVDGTARLTGFGFTSISESRTFGATLISQLDRSSTRWMAPELFDPGSQRSRASDCYAFGMTVLEVFTGQPPFHFDGYAHDIAVITAVSQGTRPGRPGAEYGMDDNLWTMITMCWADDADARPSMKSIEQKLIFLSGQPTAADDDSFVVVEGVTDGSLADE